MFFTCPEMFFTCPDTFFYVFRYVFYVSRHVFYMSRDVFYVSGHGFYVSRDVFYMSGHVFYVSRDVSATPGVVFMAVRPRVFRRALCLSFCRNLSDLRGGSPRYTLDRTDSDRMTKRSVGLTAVFSSHPRLVTRHRHGAGKDRTRRNPHFSRVRTQE